MFDSNRRIKADLAKPTTVGLLFLCVGLLVGTSAAGWFFSRQNQQLVDEVRSASARRIADAAFDVRTPPAVVADAQGLSDVFRSTAESVKDAVVYIQVVVGPSSGGGFFHNRMMRQSVGSGVIVDQNGYVVTNFHVVENASQIDITLDDKREYEAKLVGFDSSTDLAVLKIQADDLPFVPFGDSDKVEVGEWVLAVGNPFRLTSTVTAGIVSALSRDVNIIENNSSTPIEDFIQTDAAINPGNSGGALVNLAGSLVGVNTAIATESGSSEGYGFAVPSNLVRRVVTDIIEYGEVRRGYLGVVIQEMTAAEAQLAGLPSAQGVLVRNLCEGCSAGRSGLLAGDVILSVNEKFVNAPNQLQSVVASNRPGDDLLVRVWRDGGPVSLRVQLLGRDDPSTDGWLSAEIDRPVPEQRSDEPESYRPDTDVEPVDPWGFGVRELTGKDRREFGVTSGVFVAYVERQSAAAFAGLPRGSILQSIDGVDVESVNQITELLSTADNSSSHILRVVMRNGIPFFFELKSEVLN
ncbi:MAG: PDZ domain-containing protein [Rhodothermales bacterium]|nr:PDZ domain-containing protein [Rhodothermales bacterium]